MGLQRVVVGLGIVGMVVTLAACHSQPPIPQQRYDIHGKVVSVDKDQGTVTVAHDAVPGYMAAMTMAFPLKDEWAFNILKPGQTINATLVVDSEKAWLEGIVVTQQAMPQAGTPEAQEAGMAALGQEVPDFTLVNQDGKRIHLHQYRGKALVLTFIYTRCPLPNYCPLMSKNFSEIYQQVSGDAQLEPFARLLSISIDPEHDTPDVLHAYGLNYAGGAKAFAHWGFASGTPDEVRKVATFFGLKYWTQNGQIQHSLVTALIGPDGKVAKMYEGNNWQPSDVIKDLRALHKS